MPNKKNELKRAEESGNIVIHYISKILNITKHQWSRVIVSWLIQFFYRMGFIVGWTALTAMFVNRFGISSLPYLFIINAGFIIIGAIIYSNIINHFNRTALIIGTIITGASLLFLSMVLAPSNEPLFIITTIIIESIFLSQLYIINQAFIEELFTPLESEHTFPIIESAETFGGIMGGLIIVIFANQIPTYKFVAIWIILLLAIVPIIWIYHRYVRKLPTALCKKKKQFTSFKSKDLRETFKNIKHMPFIKGLLFVILIQWILVNLLEFQYTKAVVQNIGHEEVDMSQALTHGLGTLHILFHTFGLLTQLFFASRIISSLGIIGSLLLHPIVNLLSLGALTLQYGFTSAILAKTNFEITRTIHKNAYHSSYYAIDAANREQIREFLEGIAKPLGTVIGTIILLTAQQIFQGTALSYVINFVMIAVTVFMLIVLLKSENKYTLISKKNLLYSNNTMVKLNAIEILGQKGHKGAIDILVRCIKNPKENSEIKIKALETLGHLKDPLSIPDIIDCLENKDNEIKLAAVQSLSQFHDLEKHFINQAFSIHRLIVTLKDEFKKTGYSKLRSEMIHLLAKIDKNNIVPYLLKLLQSNDDKIKADCIYVCGHFNDMNIGHYILPFLKSSNFKIRANTIISLWKFSKYRVKLHPILKDMLFSKNHEERLEALYVLGEIKAVQEVKRLKEYLNSPYTKEKFIAGLSLLKMNYNIGLNVIADAMISKDLVLHKLAKKHIERLPLKKQKMILRVIKQKISVHVHELLEMNNAENLDELDIKTLLKLKKAYKLANEHEEVQNIIELLNTKMNEPELAFNPT